MSILRMAGSRASSTRILAKRTAKCFATELPRPPPPTSQPVIETFSDTSRPRPYYAKHPPFRELPRAQSKWPIALGLLITGVSGWAAFMTFATNQEKLSSSVFRSIVRALKADPQLREVLGEAIRPQPEWYLNGDPHVKGRISQLQGNIDVSFRVRGSKGSGTLYFTSIRKEKGIPFTVLRFRVICDDGTIINIADVPPAHAL
ncbi:hypothetical protein CVT25_011882 [Psilocybe cyanescens]|uniref:DUF1783-domain-containing protein n=1 Tax=Psilocybe cyanescens TaxID=93625 RepID=A0A409WIV5_PSICY|nr:hypothetical protein CVT25_011882 [Psilocybe cyanescens]